jgi:pimeloyl-ACP methyl ester carboxylesterase
MKWSRPTSRATTTAGLGEYADTVIDAIGDRRDPVVVGQSYDGFTAPLVADRLPVCVLSSWLG